MLWVKTAADPIGVFKVVLYASEFVEIAVSCRQPRNPARLFSAIAGSTEIMAANYEWP